MMASRELKYGPNGQEFSAASMAITHMAIVVVVGGGGGGGGGGEGEEAAAAAVVVVKRPVMISFQ